MRKLTVSFALILLVFAALLCGCSANDVTVPKQEDTPAFENISDTPAPSEEEILQAEINERIASMSLSDKVSALFVVWPEALQPSGGLVTELSDDVRNTLDAYPVSGICWLQINLQDTQQTSAMLHDISAAYAEQNDGLVLFQAIDEEGGTVERIAGNPGFDVAPGPDIHDIGVSGNTDAAYSTGYNIASYLSPLGFNVDFGVIGDMTSDPSDAMYLRSFGSDAALSSSMVAAETRGMIDGGIMPCIKHYPGLGGAVGGDTHEGTVTNIISEEELVAYNLATFKSASDAGISMIMTGHLSCPNIDPNYPSTLSHKIVTDILRGRLGYNGIVITDAIQMRAISDTYGDAEASVLALEAGCDLVLTPANLPIAHQGVMDAVASGRITEQHIDDSLRRILKVKLNYQKQQSLQMNIE